MGPGLRDQLSNRIEDGLGELIQLSPLQVPVEHLTYITASPSKANIVLVVDHCVLNSCESEARFRGVGVIVPES